MLAPLIFLNNVGMGIPIILYKMKANSGPSWINSTGDDTNRPGTAIGPSTIVEVWSLIISK